MRHRHGKLVSPNRYYALFSQTPSERDCPTLHFHSLSNSVQTARAPRATSRIISRCMTCISYLKVRDGLPAFIGRSLGNWEISMGCTGRAQKFGRRRRISASQPSADHSELVARADNSVHRAASTVCDHPAVGRGAIIRNWRKPT
jgi:hypothetical protein